MMMMMMICRVVTEGWNACRDMDRRFPVRCNGRWDAGYCRQGLIANDCNYFVSIQRKKRNASTYHELLLTLSVYRSHNKTSHFIVSFVYTLTHKLFCGLLPDWSFSSLVFTIKEVCRLSFVRAVPATHLTSLVCVILYFSDAFAV